LVLFKFFLLYSECNFWYFERSSINENLPSGANNIGAPLLIRAFHGDTNLKAAVLQNLASHFYQLTPPFRYFPQASELQLQAMTQGCPGDCQIHVASLETLYQRLGIPSSIMLFANSITFSDRDENIDWCQSFIKRLPVNSDLNAVAIQFFDYLFLDREDGIAPTVKNEPIRLLIEQVADTIRSGEFAELANLRQRFDQIPGSSSTIQPFMAAILATQAAIDIVCTNGNFTSFAIHADDQLSNYSTKRRSVKQIKTARLQKFWQLVESSESHK